MEILKPNKLAMAAGIAATCLVGFASAQPQAATFSAKDADGQQHSLDQYKGKVVVLEFTNPGSPTTGHPGCPFMVPRYEHKIMQNVAKQVTDAGGVYLAVNSNWYNTPADSKAVAEKYGIPYPTLQDTSGTIARAFQAKTTPHMFVIDPKGQVAYQGALDGNNDPDTSKEAASQQYVVDAVKALAAGQAPKITKTQPYGCGIKLK